MDEIFISFKNCHGINSFKHTFDFKKKQNSYNNTNMSLIYAPNGTMKTSFAKTLRDLGQDVEPINLVTNLKHASTIRIKEKGNNFELNNSEDIKKKIFVIESIKSDFKFNETAPLIADEVARIEYEKICSDLLNKKNELLSKIKDKTGISIPRTENLSYLENIINQDLNNTDSDFLEFLCSLENEFNEFLDIDLIKYDMLFNDKVLKILNDDEFIENVESFSQNLNKLFVKSKIFNKEYFTHNNAADFLKSVKKNNLFKAGHRIKFKSKPNYIDNLDDLGTLFEEQYDKIFSDSKLETQFKKINKKFSNEKTKKLQRIITEDKSLIPKLNDIPKLKREYWLSILFSLKDFCVDLIEEYNDKKLILEKIRKDAQNEKTRWQEVINIFNNRFNVPFKLKLENKEDVILNQEIPDIAYYYNINNQDKKISLDILKKISSSGQRRALYLLDIIYQIEINKDNNETTLLVFDDIADSFDYQNKYAIIEYLRDLSKDDSFRIILLTHNYDFFRTLRSRLRCDKCYFTIKNEYGSIKLINEDIEHNKGNLFSYFKEIINENPDESIRVFLTTIPFIRNLVEYTGDTQTKETLTCLLHYKEEGKTLCIKDLEPIYQYWSIELPSTSKTIYDLIYDEANKILNEEINKINFANKLILSVAIRLKSEKFMLNKLEGVISDEDINFSQTRMLLESYKEFYGQNTENISILEKVAMMTPENIHINSFMYEPILDMDDYYLKKLYKEVLELEND